MASNEALEEVRKEPEEGKAKYVRPSECRSRMRRTLAREFQGIIDGFIEAAKRGSCAHVKLATELMKPTRKATSRKKGTATLFLEMLEREDREKERLEKERLAVKCEM